MKRKTKASKATKATKDNKDNKNPKQNSEQIQQPYQTPKELVEARNEIDKLREQLRLAEEKANSLMTAPFQIPTSHAQAQIPIPTPSKVEEIIPQSINLKTTKDEDLKSEDNFGIPLTCSSSKYLIN